MARCVLILQIVALTAATAIAGEEPGPQDAVQAAPVAGRPPERAREWPDTRVGRMMQSLQELQNAHKIGQNEWARQMKEIIDVGPDAVPELIAALDATPTDDRLMLRSIPYLLRGIGDRRAIPALIRAIPRTLGKDGSDMGYHSDDADLGGFMARNNAAHSQRPETPIRSNTYGYGRPVREVCCTLEQWTGQNHNWLEINFVSTSHSTPQQLFARQKLYHECAKRWAAWWGEHWREYVDDPELADVHLPELGNQILATTVLDPQLPLVRKGGAHSNLCAQPFTESKARSVFLDLDTGRWGGLPERWAAASPDEQRQAEADIVAWAAEQGFDLMGVERESGGGTQLLLRALRLDVWEVPADVWEDKAPATAQTRIDRGRIIEKDIVHHDPTSGEVDAAATGVFFYITAEGNPGLIFLGVPVTDTSMKSGEPLTGKNELNPRYFYRGRRFATQALGVVESE